MSVEQIVSAALELPEEDREEVIAHLRTHRSRPAAIREAWIGEAERRMELVRAGKMRLIDADEVLADPEIEAVLVDLPDEQLDDLLGRVMSQRTETADEIDPAVLAEAHRRLDEMKSGRVTPVLFEQLLDELETPTVSDLEAAAARISDDDRAALVDRLIVGLTGRDGYDPVWLAELNRRIDEVEAGTAKSVPAEEVFAKMKARRDAGSLPR